MPEKHGPDVYFDFTGKSGSVSFDLKVASIEQLVMSQIMFLPSAKLLTGSNRRMVWARYSS